MFPRSFYLRGDIRGDIQDPLEWLLNELFFSDASLWNQYQLIAINIFFYKTLFISCEMLIITVISNKETIELTIYAILCQNVITFLQQELASSFKV